MSWATHQLKSFRTAASARLAAMGAPPSTTRSSMSSTSRRVISCTVRARQRGRTCSRSSRSVSCRTAFGASVRAPGCGAREILRRRCQFCSFGPTALHLFSARVATFGSGSQRLAAQKASGLQVYGREAADGMLRGWPRWRYLTAQLFAPLGCTTRYRPGMMPSGTSRRSVAGRMVSTFRTVSRIVCVCVSRQGNARVTRIACLEVSGNVSDED